MAADQHSYVDRTFVKIALVYKLFSANETKDPCKKTLSENKTFSVKQLIEREETHLIYTPKGHPATRKERKKKQAWIYYTQVLHFPVIVAGMNVHL